LVKVAIFGGSFDPPHFGHQNIIKSALETLDIDKLIVVPAYLNPFKTTSFALSSQRLLWCKRVFKYDNRVLVSDFEVINKNSYSSNTIKHFKDIYDVKYLIIGADNLLSLQKWYEFDWINQNIIWAIASRDGINVDKNLLKNWVKIDVEADISSTLIREQKIFNGVDKRIKDDIKRIYS
jgi:nicotinate-nucleotide adenylyltransferase